MKPIVRTTLLEAAILEQNEGECKEVRIAEVTQFKIETHHQDTKAQIRQKRFNSLSLSLFCVFVS